MRFLRFLLVSLSFISTSGSAQVSPQPPAPAKTGQAAISGLVLDSLHGSYLQGAEVMISGVNRTIMTDSAGRFTAAELPPGNYQVGVFHPLLDTLGLSLATKSFFLGADSLSIVVLAVPSAATLIGRSCAGRPMTQGGSAIIGRVVDPETLDPIARAQVSVAWTQVEVSKEVGVRRSPRMLYDSTDANGSFRICGLPSSLRATLQATRGRAITAEVPVVLGDEPRELFARTLLLTKTDSVIKVGTGIVRGRVTLGGAAGGGSRVELVGTEIVAATNDRGEFSLTGVPAGTHVILARHLGYGAASVPVDLVGREPKRVTIDLPKYVPMMDPVFVSARRNRSLDQVGFNERKRSGGGRYVTREEIERSNPTYLSDILRRVSGLKVEYEDGREVIRSSRGTTGFSSEACVQYYVDDMPWQSMTPGDVNDYVTVGEVMGIEVYTDATVPARYMKGGEVCTTIVVWTRMRIREQ
ncbi:MAG: carboxypeptidase regulatory-like domain-containing protein [Gemmatimonadaceae bacterium]|nr:carboxypeptidase regulatory-like domain-containing protein [Gemmatimonadaceae bacterium]